MFTVIIRKWPWWTRAQSSTSLCRRRFHPESENTKTTLFQHPRTVPLSFGLVHNISVIAQKQWQNRTQVVVSTQSFFSNISVTASVNLYLTRTLSWDWHILFFGKQITTRQPRVASDAGKSIHLKSCECPDVSLLPLWEPGGSGGGILQCLMMEEPRALEIPRCSSEGRRGCLPNCLPQVKTTSTYETKPEPSLCINFVRQSRKAVVTSHNGVRQKRVF